MSGVRDLKQQSITPHNFAMNPRAPVQRSSFPVRQAVKTAFSASYLVPIYCEEVMPGDMFSINVQAVARTAVPIVPILDNWTMELFFFYGPNRILWSNWEKFMGSQTNPGDSISFAIPQTTSPAGGYLVNTLHDYLGLPTVGQVTAAMTVQHSALPLRLHNRIINDWFRDENLQNSGPVNTGDGPDNNADYGLAPRGKRHDYFAGALPFVQKGTAVTIPLGTTAPIKSTGVSVAFDNPAATRTGTTLLLTSGVNTPTWSNTTAAATGGATMGAAGTTVTSMNVDLSAAASAQVNLMRTAIATQQLLERDARGGTRYVEAIYSHWGVRPPDYRLDRPEYIGGGSIPINTNAIPQTSATGVTGSTTPAGTLAATGYLNGSSGFRYSATEHGYILGFASVRADLTYSQGFRKHWQRLTRYDFPFPEFANLGEQAVLNKEIYAVGSATGGMGAADQDMQPFGYMPRYDECRHFPSMITGLFRPRSAGNLAYWHSSENFATLPVLNGVFIADPTRTVLERNFAGGAATQGQQFLCDFLFTGRVARPLPAYSTPGLTRF